MIKRIEFTLNLDDPREAAIYRALKPSLRYRRAGAVIRESLITTLKTDEPHSATKPVSASVQSKGAAS
jgi:hypothetical protein